MGDKKDLKVDPVFLFDVFLPFDYLSDEVPVEFQVRGVKSPSGGGGEGGDPSRVPRGYEIAIAIAGARDRGRARDEERWRLRGIKLKSQIFTVFLGDSIFSSVEGCVCGR